MRYEYDIRTGETIELPDLPPEPVSDPIAPTVCTPAQGLVALYVLKGITEGDVLTAIESIEDPVRRYIAQIGYERATEWRRDSPAMRELAALLSLSEQDLDALYTHAAGVML